MDDKIEERVRGEWVVDERRGKGPRESGGGRRTRSAKRGRRSRQFHQQRLQYEWLISENCHSKRLGHRPPIIDGVLLCFEVSPPKLLPPLVDEGLEATEALARLDEEGRVELDEGRVELEDDRDGEAGLVASGSRPTS